jgi:hypothetical protein
MIAWAAYFGLALWALLAERPWNRRVALAALVGWGVWVVRRWTHGS